MVMGKFLEMEGRRREVPQPYWNEGGPAKITS
jgi:hypothetical protein